MASQSPLNRPGDLATPFDVSIAGAICSYFLSAVVTQDVGSTEPAATLLHFPAIAIAAIGVVGAYTFLLHLAFSEAQRTPDALNDNLIAEIIIAEEKRRQSIAAASRWWHHLFGAVAGASFGCLLAFVLSWLFA